jgi:hypothetical protein
VSGEQQSSGADSEDQQQQDDKQDSDNSLETKALEQAHDGILDAWEASVPDDVRAAAVEAFTETGDVPPDHGLEQADVDTLYAGYLMQTAREVLAPIGLTAEEWAEHIAEEDLPAFRRMVLAGDWEALRNHAKAVVGMRHAMGLPLSNSRWAKLAR